MDKQIERFQNNQKDCGVRLWVALPDQSRQEVIETLAQMGRAALAARRVTPVSQSKEVGDES